MRFFWISCMLVVFLLPGFACYAITVGPTTILNKAEPGESMSDSIIVHNEADALVEVVVEFADWQFSKDEAGGVEYRKVGSLSHSCCHWIQVSPMKFELGPKESRRVTYNISFPFNTKGGYYAAIFFTAGPKSVPLSVREGTSTVVVTYQAKIGVLVYNEVMGTKKEASLVNFAVSPPADNKPLRVAYKMENLGQGYIRSEGTFHIVGADGKLYGSGNLSTAKMQQGDSARGEGEWVGKLSEGEYDLIMTLRLKPFEEKVIVQEKKFLVR